MMWRGCKGCLLHCEAFFADFGLAHQRGWERLHVHACMFMMYLRIEGTKTVDCTNVPDYVLR